MRHLFLVGLLTYPALAFSQNEVGPEGYKLYALLLFLLVALLVYFLVIRYRQKGTRSKPGSPFTFSFGGLKVDLQKDRRYRPKTLTLLIQNKKRKDVDIEAPVLLFRKLWSIRKFKLKGINRYEIYPLYLEAGKSHELRISLSVFHEHDRSLRGYYWAKVLLQDTKGKRYSSKYITLRKSLFS